MGFVLNPLTGQFDQVGAYPPIFGLTELAEAPAAGDLLRLADISAGNVEKKLTVANLFAYLSANQATLVDHGSIGGLADDDHSIYALLAGRAGGQTLYGGNAASEGLTLDSTSHAIKGNVVIQPNGGRVAIGHTGTPDAALDVMGNFYFRSAGITNPFTARVDADVYGLIYEANGCGIEFYTDSTTNPAFAFAALVPSTWVGYIHYGVMSFRAYEEDGAGQLQAIATRTKIAFNFANSSTNLVSITANGNLGLGTYGFGTNAEKVLAIYNGVEPTTSPGNQIAIFSVDVASAATLGLRTEASVAAETDETKFSHKLPIRINGAIYYVMLTAT